MSDANSRKRVGRPPKPAHLLRSEDLRIPVTPDEKAFIDAAAKLSNNGLAAWAREALLALADLAIREAEGEHDPDA